MAVREYVGARYVPVFSNVNGGVWDNTYTYEPLTIVKYGTDYYTSKKAVPTGIAITNTDYWVLTGNYNAAIATIQNQVNDLIGDVSLMKNRRFLIFGDSYDVIASVGASWSDMIISRLGLQNTVVMSQGWAGFVGDGNHETWEQMYHRIGVTDPDTITDVLFVGGTNDHSATSTAIYNAMLSLQNAILNDCPNVKTFHLAFVGWCKGFSWATQSTYLDTRLYYGGFAHNLGWAFVPNIYYVMYDPRYYRETGDSNHPNSAGVEHIADALVQYLLTGSCDVDFSYTAYMDFNTTYIQAQSGDNKVLTSIHQHNNIQQMIINQANVKIMQGTVNLTQGDTPFGTIDKEFNYLTTNRTILIPMFYVDSDDSSRQYVECGFGWNAAHEFFFNPNKIPFGKNLIPEKSVFYLFPAREIINNLQ